MKKTYTIIDARGNARKKVTVNDGDPAPVPSGMLATLAPEPKSKRSKAYYCLTDSEWKFPEKRELVNAEGEVENIILVRPDSLPDLPEGYTLRETA